MKFNETAFKDLQSWVSKKNEQDFCLLIQKMKEIDVLAANKLTEYGLAAREKKIHPDFLDFIDTPFHAAKIFELKADLHECFIFAENAMGHPFWYNLMCKID